jgi:HTH-type transcriptional regulator / antitoxin HigA
MLEEKGWTQDELAVVIGRRRQTVTEITSGKSGITPEMAVALSAVFGNPAEEWLKWDAAYRLSSVDNASAVSVQELAQLYGLAPIRDMQKRGWLSPNPTTVELREELRAFFGSLEPELPFPIAMRRTMTLPHLNVAEKAWCFRARQLAGSIAVPPFSSKRLNVIEKRLRELAAYPKEARHVSNVLTENGIQFLVIEPLPGARIDGAAFWLNETPVIAVSVRFDRIDAFWHTLMHEFAHIRNTDPLSVDTDLVGDGLRVGALHLAEDDAERRANEQAASSLVPQNEIESFIRRVGPFYSRARINQFAHKIKIHPGIIVGQLQHRGEVGYSALRETLVKVRQPVIATALTDGWKQTISPQIL